MSFALIVAFLAAGLALFSGFRLYQKVLSAPANSPRALEISAAIRSGAEAFLGRQYRTVAMVGVPIAVLLLSAVAGAQPSRNERRQARERLNLTAEQEKSIKDIKSKYLAWSR